MKKQSKKFYSEIGKIRSRKKIKAVRENGKKPCKHFQRGRPRTHEVCGSPMKRLDAFNHFCEKCKVNVRIDKVYVRPDRMQPQATA